MRNPFLFNLQSKALPQRGRRGAKESKVSLISILLLGFLSGNLFGTILALLRGFVMWDLLVIAALLSVVEFTGFVAYNPRVTERSSVLASKIKAINLFKVGMMIGFFVDAFKVGS